MSIYLTHDCSAELAATEETGAGAECADLSVPQSILVTKLSAHPTGGNSKPPCLLASRASVPMMISKGRTPG